MHVVEPVIQHYAWGSVDFIPSLLGTRADGRPWAELWLGTHPNGPARLRGRPLEEVTGRLPYLLKILAAAQPLSLQAHPTAEQAARGHAEGRYPDDQPKPELLVALTPVTALCGVRPPEATVALLSEIGAAGLAAIVEAAGPAAALHDVYRGRVDVDEVVTACQGSHGVEARWVTELSRRYPGDPSVIATLLLNLVELEPGEWLFLGAGNLHAYLGGAGVELMNASDNVVRGGLTTKHVDIDDLLDVVDPTPLVDPVRPPTDVYELHGTSIRLHRLDGPTERTAAGHELAITTAGRTLYAGPGDRFVIAAAETAYVASATD